MELLKINKRDICGFIGWFILALVIGVIAEPIMIYREYYQWKKYNLERLEIEDIVRYSFIIIFASVINLLIWKLWIL